MTAPIKSAANEAAALADVMTRHLLIAGISSTPTDEIRQRLTKAFSIWPKLSRAMVALERVAPNCAAAGNEDDGDLLHEIEIRRLSNNQRSAA